jgi:LmbE family N-acetylglucosaminyl deacetylase
MNRRIAVVAAHPDDEVLGCGGTIARHTAEGDQVHVLIVSEGATSRGATRDRSKLRGELSQLAAAARRANQLLGTSNLELLDFPDNRLDGIDLLDVVKAVEGFLDKCKPQTVYTHWPSDLNVDHRVVSEAVQTACRPIPACVQEQLLFFEVPSSTEWRAGAGRPFEPNYFVDVSATLELKQRALSAYETEMRAWPHSRSLEAVQSLARWRGASVGVAAAEAFTLGRALVRWIEQTPCTSSP